ncbi:CIS tube protein [Paractinoplanes globisporus]|jgi:nucleoid-associated protein YgaU|uniref:Peptidoglycan-binding protein n=1 Tax=Paractinoplanes globisporus TaxID=113565 RepID=A0ABW6W9Z3_9ACTN|nr:hypothetical protein [Actinoplanes globisporus]
MNPQKAMFYRLNPDGTPGAGLAVQFNPTEYTLAKTNQIAEVPIPGLDSPILQFVRGQAETFAVELFFDSTEAGTAVNATPVTDSTDKFYDLIKIESGSHAPPVLLFSWGGTHFPGRRAGGTGSNSRNGFKCVVESVRQRYTLFDPAGVPLRAVVTLALREYKTLAEQVDQLNLQSADHTKAHVLAEGETLSRVAYLAYDDPARWRVIAEANDIDDPLDVAPGTVLALPRTLP